MTQIKPRKQRTTFTTEQKLDYAKLMVNENYTNKHKTTKKLGLFYQKLVYLSMFFVDFIVINQVVGWFLRVD
jgi:hypothetical protein